jgi:hypothetical protein
MPRVQEELTAVGLPRCLDLKTSFVERDEFGPPSASGDPAGARGAPKLRKELRKRW